MYFPSGKLMGIIIINQLMTDSNMNIVATLYFPFFLIAFAHLAFFLDICISFGILCFFILNKYASFCTLKYTYMVFINTLGVNFLDHQSKHIRACELQIHKQRENVIVCKVENLRFL